MMFLSQQKCWGSGPSGFYLHLIPRVKLCRAIRATRWQRLPT
jgi:hypothetical protein